MCKIRGGMLTFS